MDYLDVKKQFRHHVILFVGYVLIAIGIVTAALILLYQAYGFGVTKNGTVIQSGLLFFSSQPNPAQIYINGKLQPVKTNTRLSLPADIYRVTLARAGYRDWQRTINLEGGSVEHFDYPFLIPKQLTTTKKQTYTAAPGLFTQSPDKRWLLVGQPGSLTTYEEYDLKNPAKAATALELPSTLLTKAANGGDTLQLVEWADDNQHLLLKHSYDAKTEFVLIDRNDPAQSVNLNTALALNPTALTLNDKKYDHYYIYDTPANSLRTITLRDTTPVARLQNVLAYKSYSNDTVLYATSTDAPKGKVLIRLISGNKTTTVRSLPAGDTYLVDLTKYDGTMYVAAGSTNDNKVYIYRDPAGQLATNPKQAAVPTQVLHVEQPNYLSFSSNTQFIVAENGTRFGVYDIENKLGYNYTATAPLDTPQLHATWMDGNRLAYVSNGKVTIADYDNLNRQPLSAATSGYIAAFDPSYKYIFTIAPVADGQFQLTQTALLTTADQ